MSAEAKSVKPKTLKNAWMMVAAALKFGGYDVPKVTLPQVPPNERQWLDPEQIRVFVADVANEPFAIPALLALHGLRRSEIMAVNWSDIDLTAKTIRVSGAVVIGEDQRPQQKASNKNRSSTRTIPIMIPELLAALEAVEDKSGPVVRCNPNTIYHQINRVCAQWAAAGRNARASAQLRVAGVSPRRAGAGNDAAWRMGRQPDHDTHLYAHRKR